MAELESQDSEQVRTEITDSENSGSDSGIQICQKSEDNKPNCKTDGNNADEKLENSNKTTETPEEDNNAVSSPKKEFVNFTTSLKNGSSVSELSADVVSDSTKEDKPKDQTDQQNVTKDNTNQMTVALVMKEEDRRNPPEIVVEPKIAETLPSGKITQQVIRVVTPVNGSVPAGLRLPPKQSQTTKEHSFCKKFKYCLLLVIFTVIVIGYAIGGAYLFFHLERKSDIEHNAKIDKWKNDTAILLATELRQVKPHEEVWARKVFQYLEVFEKDLLKASALGYRRQDHKDRDKRWTWTSSLFFSVSLMTTTGYGPMTPRSDIGRLAAVFYSLLGIPLAFTWLIVTGHILATVWMSLFKNICCRLCREDTIIRQSEILSKPNQSKPLNFSKTRSNSIVPIEEQKLLSQNKSQHKNSRNFQPEDLHDKFIGRNNSLMNKEINFQNKIHQTEITETQDIYYTMDYVVAIIYAFLFFVVYYIFFAICFYVTEEWMLTDVLYINFLLFLTLGPGCHELDDNAAEIKIKNNVLYTMHLCIGYCILAMIANLLYMMLRKKI